MRVMTPAAKGWRAREVAHSFSGTEGADTRDASHEYLRRLRQAASVPGVYDLDSLIRQAEDLRDRRARDADDHEAASASDRRLRAAIDLLRELRDSERAR